jgi:hypothetical protein
MQPRVALPSHTGVGNIQGHLLPGFDGDLAGNLVSVDLGGLRGWKSKIPYEIQENAGISVCSICKLCSNSMSSDQTDLRPPSV